MPDKWHKEDYAYEILEEINKLNEERLSHDEVMAMVDDLKKINSKTISFMWQALTVHGMTHD